MNTGLETQIVQALGGLLVAFVTGWIGYLAPKVKKWVGAHTNAKTAATATTAINGLSTIAQNVVADFNQRIVSDAKNNGVWNAQLAQQIKHDAVQSVMSQAGNLTSLASATAGNVQDMVSSMVEQAVAANHLPTVGVALAQTSTQPTAPA